MPKAKQVQYRTALLERDATDQSGQRFALSFASELPVKRRDSDGNFYWEVLSHAPGDANLGFLNRAGMVLQNHDHKKEIGDVVKGSAKVDADRKSRARIQLFAEQTDWSTRAKTDPSAIPVSVGYDPMSILSEEAGPENIPLLRFAWRPFEVSLLTVAPADDTVGINRAMVKRRCADCEGTGRCRCRAADDDDADKDCPECNGKGKCADCGGGGYFSSARQAAPAPHGKQTLVDLIPTANADDIAKNLTAEQKKDMKRILLDLAAGGSGGGGGATLTVADVTTAETRGKTTGIAEGQNILFERNKQIDAICDALLKGNEGHTDKDGKRMDVKINEFRREECAKPVTSDKLERMVIDFQMRAFKEIQGATPAKLTSLETLGFDEQDRKNYSLLRAIGNCIERDSKVPDPDTLEGAAHVRMMKGHRNLQPQGFLVPPDANLNPRTISRSERSHLRRMGRDLTAGTFAQGGALVATDLVMPVIDVLRNTMVTDKMGITNMGGLSSNILIPRQTATATAYSVPETGLATLSTQVLDQIALTPKRATVWNNYSKLLLIQASADAEAFIRRDIFAVMARYIDEMILNGQGTGDQPLGIMNTPGIQSILFGGAATYANIVLMETEIDQLNAPMEGRGYVTTSKAKGKLKSAAKLLVGATTVAAESIWTGSADSEFGMLNDCRALHSQQIPNDQMIFGSWPSSIAGFFGGFDFLVNPYSGDTQALYRVTCNVFFDHVLRHPQSFCVSADSAAQ